MALLDRDLVVVPLAKRGSLLDKWTTLSSSDLASAHAEQTTGFAEVPLHLQRRRPSILDRSCQYEEARIGPIVSARSGLPAFLKTPVGAEHEVPIRLLTA